MDPSRLVEVLPERVGSVSSPHFPHNAPGKAHEHAWSLPAFRRSLQTRITRMSPDRIELDLVGVDASIANAIRRTLMAEVPTVAIENVYVWNNTSIVQDEVLSHRLGLVPLYINPDQVDFKDKPETPATEANTFVFHLKVKCERLEGAKKGDPEHKAMKNGSVYSSMLKWVPQGGQMDEWGADPPRAVYEDILLAKLRPGQELSMEVHCVKGIGKEHAKWSPVATASYRLLPHIDILTPIAKVDIPKFVKCFPPGVIGIRRDKTTGEEEAYVKDPRRDTVSREVLRHKEFEDKIRLGRVRDHFLFDIESTGIYEPQRLLPSALKVLADKLRVVREGVEALERQHNGV